MPLSSASGDTESAGLEQVTDGEAGGEDIGDRPDDPADRGGAGSSRGPVAGDNGRGSQTRAAADPEGDGDVDLGNV